MLVFAKSPRTEVPRKNSKVTSYSSELHRILKLTSRAAFSCPRAGWGQCPNSPFPLAVPSCGQRTNHPELQSFKQELFHRLSDFYSPTTHSPCACEGGDQQDLQFSLFSLTSHLVLQYYSWPGTIRPLWWCLTQRLKSAKHTITRPIEFNWDMLQSLQNEAQIHRIQAVKRWIKIRMCMIWSLNINCT